MVGARGLCFFDNEAVKEIGHINLKALRERPQHGRRDGIGARLVAVDLLQGHATSLSDIGKRQAQALSPRGEPVPDV
jgi:hypothetical protein